MTLVAEFAPPRRRGLYTSFVLSAPPAGIVLASVAFLWAASLGDDALLAWAWRVPFLVSVVLFALAVFIRAAFSLSFMTSPEVGMSRGSALLAVSIGSVCGVLTTPLGGLAADRFGSRAVLATGSLLGAVGAFPLFWALSSGDLVLASVAIAVGYGLVIACTSGSQGAFLAGLAIGGFWGMGANFAQRIGLDVGGISAFMAAVLGGTLALQWPLGWLSDRMPRNLVIAGAALASAASAIGVALAVEAPLPLLLAAGALFGGFGIPIYSLCLAVANDDLPASRLLGTARGLLLLNGIGTAAGPLIGGAAMAIVGPGGLFLYAAALLIILAVLAVTRRQPSPPNQAKAGARCPSTPMITGSLDTMICMEGRSQDVRH